MGVIVARLGTPESGRQSEALAFAKKRAAAFKKLYGIDQEVRVRLGGPVGQVLTVTRHDSLGEVETMKRKVIADTDAGKIPLAPPGVFKHSEEQIWLTQ